MKSKTKRKLSALIITVLLICGSITALAEDHVHNPVLYAHNLAYHYVGDCKVLMFCTKRIYGYDDRYRCSICGNETGRTYTIEKHSLGHYY